MRNRAKCKLCQSILESYHAYDYVSCKCGEISITGGQQSYECSAKDFANFLRVDDEGNEIVVKTQSKDEVKTETKDMSKPNRDELLQMLDEMIKDIDKLPSSAMQSPISHYDHQSLLIMIAALFRA